MINVVSPEPTAQSESSSASTDEFPRGDDGERAAERRSGGASRDAGVAADEALLEDAIVVDGFPEKEDEHGDRRRGFGGTESARGEESGDRGDAEANGGDREDRDGSRVWDDGGAGSFGRCD